MISERLQGSSSTSTPSINKPFSLTSTVVRRPGSNPPNCVGRCGKCVPCMAVRIPIEHIRMGHANVAEGATSHGAPMDHVVYVHMRHAPIEGAVRVNHIDRRGKYGLMEYYPETWRCKCKDNIFIP